MTPQNSFFKHDFKRKQKVMLETQKLHESLNLQTPPQSKATQQSIINLIRRVTRSQT